MIKLNIKIRSLQIVIKKQVKCRLNVMSICKASQYNDKFIVDTLIVFSLVDIDFIN